MYLSKLLNVFVKILKCICPNCKMYLSKLQNIFVKVLKCICPIFLMTTGCLPALLLPHFQLHNTCEQTKHRLTKIRPTKYQATKYRLTFIFEFSSTYLWKLLPRRPLSRTECGTSTTMKVQHMSAGNNY